MKTAEECKDACGCGASCEEGSVENHRVVAGELLHACHVHWPRRSPKPTTEQLIAEARAQGRREGLEEAIAFIDTSAIPRYAGRFDQAEFYIARLRALIAQPEHGTKGDDDENS